MNKSEIEAKIAVLLEQREHIQSQIKPLQDQLGENHKQHRELSGMIVDIELEYIDTASEDERIIYFLENDGDRKGRTHFSVKEKFWEDMGFRPSGYYPDIKQQGLTITLYQDKSENQKTVDIIRKVLPHMKTLSGFDKKRPNVKIFSIMEHTCAEYGSYSLLFDEDADEWVLSIISWGRRSDVRVSNSLETIIDYISVNHAYDGDEDDSEDY